MKRCKLPLCTKLNEKNSKPRFSTTSKLTPRKLEMMSRPLRKRKRCKRISSIIKRINTRLRLELLRLSSNNSKRRPNKTRIEFLLRRS